MPLTFFYSPTGRKCKFDDDELTEYYPRPYLMHCIDRDRDGLHVSDILCGTRQSYLKITEEYGISPDEMAFAILGTRSHGALDSVDKADVMTEVEVEVYGLKGRIDLLERHDDGWWLIDYKTWGSRVVMRALGYYQEVEPIIENGEPVYFKSGKNKGKPKTKKIWKVDPEHADYGEAGKQLNIYACMFEAGWNDIPIPSKKVTRLRIFAIVRDYGTATAYARGIDKAVRYFDVPRDDRTLEYIKDKRTALENCLKEKIMPPVCSPEECWNGQRCRYYCDVRDNCRKIGDNPYFVTEGTDAR